MKMLRAAAVVIIWFMAFGATVALCLRPWKCNRAEATAHRRTLSMMQIDPMRRHSSARVNIDILNGCHRLMPHRVSLNMVLAANYRFAGRPEVAVDLYRSSLEWDRRPELYLNLGEALIESGREEEGVSYLKTAAVYNPLLAEEIPAYSGVMQAAVAAYQTRLAERRKQ